MAKTYKELKAALRLELFPSGEALNLVVAHDKAFLEAVIDIQRSVPCHQFNNTQIFEACNTLFKCGMTVIDKPRGRIKRLVVMDKINQTTGLEDADSEMDWCSEIEYREVPFDHLQRYVSSTLAGSSPISNFWPWFMDVFGGLNLRPFFNSPGYSFGKWVYPAPDDLGLDAAPSLPLGYHYAQEATDDTNGRAQFGMWAKNGGQIFVCPWIQSTETIMVEWDGLKRIWDDLDLVPDGDPDYEAGVREYVRMEHARTFGRDPMGYQAALSGYKEAIARMMYDCRKETMNRIPDVMDNAAQASTLTVPRYTNDEQSATAYCPQGQEGDAVTVTVPANTVVSTISKGDANAKAKSQALQAAGAQLSCEDEPVTYWNTPQTFEANCGAGTGNPVTVTTPANTYSSIVSQADANEQALNAATAAAQGQVDCTYANVEQSYTASCPDGSTGDDVTKTIAAGVYTSEVSQSDADSLALAAATTEANNALVCNITPTVFFNTPQVASLRFPCTTRSGVRYLTVEVTVNANTFSSLVSVAAANLAAYQHALANAQGQAQAACQRINI